VVTLVGHTRDTSLAAVAARLVRAVEGVVDVQFDLTGPHGSQEHAHTPADQPPTAT